MKAEEHKERPSSVVPHCGAEGVQRQKQILETAKLASQAHHKIDAKIKLFACAKRSHKTQKKLEPRINGQVSSDVGQGSVT
jgi:hypothetical protein